MFNNKKIIFMGTPEIATEYINALLKNNINIDAIFTQPPQKQSRGLKLIKSPVHILASKKNIEIFHPKTFDSSTLLSLNKLKPDLIIVMAYGKILPKTILNLPKKGCINVHLSLLPRWRGAAPIEYTLMNGDKETGVSIIKLVEQLDAGPIIAQRKMTIPSEYNKQSLSKSLTILGTKLLLETIPKILNNNTEFITQDEKKVTYAHKINSQIRKINFNNDAKSIINHIRAHSPKPGAWLCLNGERIKIIDAKSGSEKGEKSTILNSNFEIGCKDGSILPLILQREGKKVVTIDDFLRGFKPKIYDVVNA
tara:strand:+ start:216 stop:1142 length:927 start_codon:yes stop_codon:yes gene_type:complete